MKTKRYPHGTAFVESFTITLRGGVVGAPLGWGCQKHLKAWLESALRDAVTEAVARYYQCQLEGTSLEIRPLDTLLDTPGYCPAESNILPAQSGQNQKNPLAIKDKST